VTPKKAADEDQASLPFPTSGVAGCRVCRGDQFLQSKHHAKLREKFII
jgi:hypothetical protein